MGNTAKGRDELDGWKKKEGGGRRIREGCRKQERGREGGRLNGNLGREILTSLQTEVVYRFKD